MASSSDHGNEPSGSIKGADFITSLASISFSKRNVLYGVSQLV